MTAPAEEPASVSRRLLFSVEEAAELLGIGRTFMFQLVATGEIDSLKIGKKRKIPRDAIDGYIRRLRSEHAAGSEASHLRTFGSSIQPGS